jgi:hypothetical protein
MAFSATPPEKCSQVAHIFNGLQPSRMAPCPGRAAGCGKTEFFLSLFGVAPVRLLPDNAEAF